MTHHCQHDCRIAKPGPVSFEVGTKPERFFASLYVEMSPFCFLEFSRVAYPP